MFFEEDCIDEYREAIAPIKVNEGVQSSKFKVQGISKSIRSVGQMVVNEHIIHPYYDLIYLQQAIDLSRLTPPSDSAYSVGCVIVSNNGAIFTGYTHQTAPHNHAEEEAIAAALTAGADLSGAVAYCSLEPCSVRKSKPVSCSELLIKYGFARVVYAASEPDCFVVCEGAANMRTAGVKVHQIKDLQQQVFEINKHILK
jgi:5-amino-6-(5-phosphoribosylamino)uracil reductase